MKRYTRFPATVTWKPRGSNATVPISTEEDKARIKALLDERDKRRRLTERINAAIESGETVLPEDPFKGFRD